MENASEVVAIGLMLMHRFPRERGVSLPKYASMIKKVSQRMIKQLGFKCAAEGINDESNLWVGAIFALYESEAMEENKSLTNVR